MFGLGLKARIFGLGFSARGLDLVTSGLGLATEGLDLAVVGLGLVPCGVVNITGVQLIGSERYAYLESSPIVSVFTRQLYGPTLYDVMY